MTQDKGMCLTEQGFKLVKMKECQYQPLHLNKYLPAHYQGHRTSLTQEKTKQCCRWKIVCYGGSQYRSPRTFDKSF